MEENVIEKVVKKIDFNFSIQHIAYIKSGIIDYHRYNITIKDPNGNEIIIENIDPAYYSIIDSLRNIRRLYYVYDPNKNEAFAKCVREEILRQIAMIIAKIYLK